MSYGSVFFVEEKPSVFFVEEKSKTPRIFLTSNNANICIAIKLFFTTRQLIYVVLQAVRLLEVNVFSVIRMWL